MERRFALCLVLAFALFFGSLPAYSGSAPHPLDGFDPNANNKVNVILTQPDGKILVGGEFTQIAGAACGCLARLNPDGTIDSTFKLGAGAESSSRMVLDIALQSDGKILVGGIFSKFNGVAAPHLIRLNPDGSVDTSFHASGTNPVISIAVRPDGKILVARDYETQFGTGRLSVINAARLFLLNQNGSIDTGFKYVQDTGFKFSGIEILSDGKLLQGGKRKLGADGTIDSSYKLPFAAPEFMKATVQPDGKILLCGDFSIQTGGRTFNGVLRVNTDGSLDPSFNPGSGAAEYRNVYAAAVLPDGKIMIGGQFTKYNGTPSPGLLRLNRDGSVDKTFNLGNLRWAGAFGVQPDGELLVGGSFANIGDYARNNIARLNADGNVDADFDPGTGADGQVFVMAMQRDQSILAAGTFRNFNEVPKNRMTRLDEHGAFVPGFNPGEWVNGNILCGAALPNGQTVVCGHFTYIGSQPANHIAWINPNGSVQPPPGNGANDAPYSLCVQPDGKLLIGGCFTKYNGVARGRIARLHANHELDTSFNPGTGASFRVMTIALQRDGKVLLGGLFTFFNDEPCTRITRLLSNGSIDRSFICPAPDAQVNAIAVQPDGKIIVAGHFSSMNGKPNGRITRLNTDGSIDPSFKTGSGADNVIWTLQIQSDGKILIGGDFTFFNGYARNRLARLNPDGSLDTSYAPGSGAEAAVNSLVLAPDGKLLIGGAFTKLRSFNRNRIARLTNPTPARQSLTFSGGTLSWNLGGSFPQPYHVVFDESPDGNTWRKLGSGTCVPGVGFQLGKVSLSSATQHYIRATGYVAGGLDCACVSLVESKLLVYGPFYRNAAGDWAYYD